MAKEKSFAEDLIVGGIGLSVGAGVVEGLPVSAAKTGVQKGLGTAGGFLPVMATIGIAGGLVKQLKEMPRRNKVKEIKSRRFRI